MVTIDSPAHRNSDGLASNYSDIASDALEISVDFNEGGRFDSGLIPAVREPKDGSSVGMTSSFIWSISHRQIGAPSDESSEKPRSRRRFEKRAYSAY
jgi:hypothetical protein